MMAKMFYTLDEAKASLGRSEEDIKQLAREGRLREFRDGARLMFKADQVEQLRAEMGGGGGAGDVISLGDSQAPIGLVDSRSASGTGISLVDSEPNTGSSGVGSGGMQMKDDTALAADLGLSGSVGGVPSPSRPGSGGSGSGLSGSVAGGSRAGVNVFAADDSIEPADPMAQTAISAGGIDQVNLEGVGSGSGLLDLTRESDDTSLGAELLDEIAPGKGRTPSGITDTATGTALGGAAVDIRGGRAAGGAAVFQEARDTSAGAFGGAALGASLFLIVGALVLTSAVVGARPGLVQTLTQYSFIVLAAIGLGLALVFGIVGLVIGKSAR
jgi:hypothetical protein